MENLWLLTSIGWNPIVLRYFGSRLLAAGASKSEPRKFRASGDLRLLRVDLKIEIETRVAALNTRRLAAQNYYY